MSKHTKGPWVAKDKGYGWSIEAIGVWFGNPSWLSKKKTKANAILIAAAPDLLEAAEWLISSFQGAPYSLDMPAINTEIENLEEAIAKANGE